MNTISDLRFSSFIPSFESIKENQTTIAGYIGLGGLVGSTLLHHHSSSFQKIKKISLYGLLASNLFFTYQAFKKNHSTSQDDWTSRNQDNRFIQLTGVFTFLSVMTGVGIDRNSLRLGGKVFHLLSTGLFGLIGLCSNGIGILSLLHREGPHHLSRAGEELGIQIFQLASLILAFPKRGRVF